ncbi:MAG: serine protein kinase RIO [Thermoplasmata archaeon]
MPYDAKSQGVEKALERVRDSWKMRRKDDDDRKSYDEVFNKQNLMRIYKLMTDGVVDKFDFTLSTGKEGNLFRASTAKGEFVAVKIFRTSTATFGDMYKYVAGDPRFHGVGGGNRKRLIMVWAEKEFMNLEALHWAGVRVPKPIARNQNIIVMEYIGDESEPARQLRNVALEDPEKVARKILDYMRLSYSKAYLVHCDLSEFNILILAGEPVIIDVGQAVHRDHPNALEWLRRDLNNIARYFRKKDVEIDVEAELREITKR